MKLSADSSAISYGPLMSESINLVIGAKNFSLPLETEFFNRKGQTQTFSTSKNGDPKVAYLERHKLLSYR